jgi:hypothetical protein
MLRETGLAGRPLEHFEILRHSSLPRQPNGYFGDLDVDGLDQLLPPPRAGTPSDEPPEASRARHRDELAAAWVVRYRQERDKAA